MSLDASEAASSEPTTPASAANRDRVFAAASPSPMARAQGSVTMSSNGEWSGAPLPRLHYCAYKGDLEGLLSCITEGHGVSEVVSMRNQHNKIVCGITPLFLAAQKGHKEVCKMLVLNGANPNQPAYIQGTTDLCTPAQVARLNLHFMLARWLKKAVRKRKEEDKVLAEDEEPPASAVRAQRAASGSSSSRGAQGANAAEAYMAGLDDLGDWDPSSGLAAPQLDKNQVTKLMAKNHIDLLKWRPDAEQQQGDQTPQQQHHQQHHQGEVQGEGSGTPTAHQHHHEHEAPMSASKSRVISGAELAAATLEVEDNSQALGRFLKDMDLTSWQPDATLGASPAAGTPQHKHKSKGGLAAFFGFGKKAQATPQQAPSPAAVAVAGGLHGDDDLPSASKAAPAAAVAGA